ncbi:MAG: hypothetical protein KQI78_21375 [Deltaproteobacteria bacterium]|jgi:hypothetical protein|nr:hypothetical protein [Deltaproteobacteria bacterium]
MRLFALASFQDIMLYLFPTLIFMVLFGVGLAFTRFHRQTDEQREKEIIYRYPTGIEDRNAAFPLVMTLIIVGTFIWAFFYILMHGVLGVKI